MLRLIGICLTLAGSFGSGLAFCREKSRHAGTLFLLAELFLRMAEEIGYSAERLPDVFSQMSVWLAKDAENDSFGKEEASALAEALLHCADRLEQERSEPLERRTRCMGSSNGALEGRSQKAAFLCKGAGLSRPGTTKTVDAQAVRRIQKPGGICF